MANGGKRRQTWPENAFLEQPGADERSQTRWVWIQLSAAVGALFTLTWFLPRPWSAPDWGPRSADPAQVAILLTSSCLVWLLLSWAVLVAATAVLTRVPGRVGRYAGAWLARVAPLATRRLLVATVGVSLLGGLAAACSTDQPPAGGSTAAGAVAGAAVRSDLTSADQATGAAVGSDLTSARQATGATGTAAAGGTGAAAGPVAGTARGVPSPPPAEVAFIVGFPTSHTETPVAPTIASRIQHEPVDLEAFSPAPADRVRQDPPAGIDVDWPSTGQTSEQTVVVHRGDSLWAIAARHLPAGATDAQIDASWRQWYAANRGVIGADPNLILPGQQLLPPSTGTGNTP